MRDQLPEYLRPTTDMRKAVNRNTKNDEELSHVPMQLDKEKKMVIKQLSSKQDTFKREIIKRQQPTVNEHFLEPANLAAVHRRKGLRRAFSVDNIRSSSSVGNLPPVLNKRQSYPASPMKRRDDDEEHTDHHSSCHARGEITSPRRKNATITCDFNVITQQLQNKCTIDDCPEAHSNPVHKVIPQKPCMKSQDSATQKAPRRHSTVAAPRLYNSRPLQRRRLAVHSLISSVDQTLASVADTSVRCE